MAFSDIGSFASFSNFYASININKHRYNNDGIFIRQAHIIQMWNPLQLPLQLLYTSTYFIPRRVEAACHLPELPELEAVLLHGLAPNCPHGNLQATSSILLP